MTENMEVAYKAALVSKYTALGWTDDKIRARWFQDRPDLYEAARDLAEQFPLEWPTASGGIA